MSGTMLGRYRMTMPRGSCRAARASGFHRRGAAPISAAAARAAAAGSAPQFAPQQAAVNAAGRPRRVGALSPAGLVCCPSRVRHVCDAAAASAPAGDGGGSSPLPAVLAAQQEQLLQQTADPRGAVGAVGDGDDGEAGSSETTEPFDVLTRVNKNTVPLFCSGCHKSVRRKDPGIAECTGCHRRFHPECHRRQCGGPGPSAEQCAGQATWHHDQSCQTVLQSLVKLCRSGTRELSARAAGSAVKPSVGSRSSGGGSRGGSDGSEPGSEWRMVFCRSPGLPGRVALGQVLSVLSPEWGYTMQDLTQFDFAAVLKLPPDSAPGGGIINARAGGDGGGGKAGKRAASGNDDARGKQTTSSSGGGGGGNFRGGAACAALLDVYGGDVAELFVVGTLPDARRRGCARDLVVRALAPALADAGVRRLAVSVDAGDGNGAAVWRALGFAPLPPPEARWLAWQLPQFGREASEGSDYFWMDLAKVRGQGGY